MYARLLLMLYPSYTSKLLASVLTVKTERTRKKIDELYELYVHDVQICDFGMFGINMYMHCHLSPHNAHKISAATESQNTDLDSIKMG